MSLLEEFEECNPDLIAARGRVKRLERVLKTLLTALDAPTAYHPTLGPRWMEPAIAQAKSVLGSSKGKLGEPK